MSELLGKISKWKSGLKANKKTNPESVKIEALLKLIKTDNLLITLSKNVSSSQIKEAVQDCPAVKLCEISNVVERTDLPAFIPSLLSYVETTGEFPRQQTKGKKKGFWQYYRREKKAEIDVMVKELAEKTGSKNKEIEEQIKSRVFRAYYSLVRDVHLGLKCLESEFFEQVVYDFDLDQQYGIDILVKHKGRYFALSLFTDTVKSYDALWRRLNQGNHVKVEDITTVYMPIMIPGKFNRVETGGRLKGKTYSNAFEVIEDGYEVLRSPGEHIADFTFYDDGTIECLKNRITTMVQ